jgi:2-keto-3-deoxy-L-rhamnonate aldolase RhmA
MSSVNNIEVIRQRLEAGEVVLGMGVTFSDPAISELIAEAGYDFSWLDMEHAPLDHQTVLQHIVAHRGTRTAPFVRVQENDVNVIKPVLDLAPAGIIVPQVNSATEAEAVVRACRYPPVGVRGYGPRRGPRFGAISQPDYLEQFADDPIIVIQIEHVDAVKNLDEILAVPGIDILCLGLNDLSGSMGKLGQIDDPQMRAAVDEVAQKVGASDRILGISTFYSAETYARWMELGIKWLNLNVDFANLFRASREVIEAARPKGS